MRPGLNVLSCISSAPSAASHKRYEFESTPALLFLFCAGAFDFAKGTLHVYISLNLCLAQKSLWHINVVQ